VVQLFVKHFIETLQINSHTHSAIVAREMGIPAIVGIPNLLDKIEDGDEIEIDGGTGIVTIIEDK